MDTVNLNRRSLILGAGAAFIVPKSAKALPHGSLSANQFIFNVTLTANAIANASAQWKADCETARLIYANLITDAITVNASVDWTGSGSGGATSSLSVNAENYSNIRTALQFRVPVAMWNAIPVTIPAGWPTGIVQSSNRANMKALGLFAARGGIGNDFTTTVAAGVPDSARVGVFLHEFSHGLGREDQSVPAALSCFNSSDNSFVYNASGIQTYFSLSGPTASPGLALFDIGQASSPDHSWQSILTDPFNVLYSAGTTLQTLTALDKQIMNAMGYTLAP